MFFAADSIKRPSATACSSSSLILAMREQPFRPGSALQAVSHGLPERDAKICATRKARQWKLSPMAQEVDSPACNPPVPAKAHTQPASGNGPVLPVLVALSFAHLLNDTMQSLIPAIYPMLKDALQLDFRHIGLITLVNQLTASLLQPFVGFFTDRRPQPYSLALGMSFTLAGLVVLALASSLSLVLLAVAFVGVGSWEG